MSTSVTPIITTIPDNETIQTTDAPELSELIFKSDVIWLMFTTLMTGLWILYLVYYNSRMFGFVLTRIINKFVTGGYVKIGSFSVSLLSGKVMFRDFHFMNEDFSLRVQDGWAIFRWWRPYKPMPDQADMSHAETRLNILLNGLEYHQYNRSTLFSQIEKKFGLEPTMIPESEKERKEAANQKRHEQTAAIRKQSKDVSWRDLIPVIKVDVSTGRVVFGNRLVPTTLTVSFEDAHIMYTTKQASTPLDQFMHSVKCNGENVRLMFAPSPKFQGQLDEPPRYMGEGFVMLQSNAVDFYYYWDEPGLVPDTLEDYEISPAPCWGMNVKCGKGTDLSYGPWADRQREWLHKLFYPVDYQDLVVTKPAQPGDTRQSTSFDFRLNIIADATIDILFTKCKETNAIHMNIGAGSYIEVIVPWVVHSDGYRTSITGQLLHVDSSTSLQYRSFIESETLQFSVNVHYPMIWNHHQTWECDLTFCKGTWFFIYQHKTFLLDLMNDWSSKSKPDLLSFTPYTWQFNLVFNEFELILPSNLYNWIDCSSQNQENVLLAICGEHFDISFNLPFSDFLPETVPIKFWIAIENADLRIFIPYTSRHVLLALDRSCKEAVERMKCKEMTDNSNTSNKKMKSKWRNVTQESTGWIDCLSVPEASLNLGYTYYPLPPNDDLPMKVAPSIDSTIAGTSKDTKVAVGMLVDPSTLPPDVISVEFDMGPSELFVYGSILRHFYFLKENFFGEDQMFTDLSSSCPSQSMSPSSSVAVDITDKTDDENINPLTLRPLCVTVSASITNVRGYFPKHCGEKDGMIPVAHLEQLCFEMHKTYRETKLQLLLSPVTILMADTYSRPDSDIHLKEGHLTLSGLQVRGHAMFSGEDLPPTSETLEYAWLVEVQVGSVSGKVTLPQIQSLANFAQMFVFLALNSENTFQPPLPYKKCQHDAPQHLCTRVDANSSLPCQLVEDVKYEMTRVSLDHIDLYLVDTGSACHFQLYPLRIATCNLHGINTEKGVTVMIRNIEMKQYIAHSSDNYDNHSDYETWIEAGGVSLGPIVIDAAMPLSHPQLHQLQEKFLNLHDRKTKRLWFLWPMDNTVFNPEVIGKCGCLGGCKFFGNNSNGVNFFDKNKFSPNGGQSDTLFTVVPGEEGDQSYAYGQSLLEEGQLVFAVCERRRSPEGSPTRPNFKFTPGYVQTFSPQARSRGSSSASARVPASGRHGSHGLVHKMSTQAEVTDQTHGRRSSETQHRQASRESSLRSKSSIHSSGHDLHVKYLGGQPPLVGSCHSLPVEALYWDKSAQHIRHHSFDMGEVEQMASPVEESKSSVHFSLDSQDGLPSEKARASRSKQSVGSRVSGLPPRGSLGQIRQTQSETSLAESDFFSASEDGSYTPPFSSEDRFSSLASQKLMQEIMGLSAPGAPVVDLEGEIESDSPSTSQSESIFVTDSEPKSKSTSTSSGLSFVSAVSSPTDLLPEHLEQAEIFTRGAAMIGEPMTEYPGLMSCYASHLSQMQCDYWQTLPPSQQLASRSSSNARTSLGSVASYESIQLPLYTLHQKGLGIRLLHDKLSTTRDNYDGSLSGFESDSESESDTLVGLYRKVVYQKRPENIAEQDEEEVTNEPLTESDECKTRAIVQVRGSVDAMVSPLMVEALQRYVESLTPQVSNIHPSTLLDNLHFNCLGEVKDHHKITTDDCSSPSPKHEEKEDSPTTGSTVASNASKVSSIQVFVSLARVNLCIFQASLEETCLPAYPGNVRQKSFVSLLALSADNISADLLMRDRSFKALPAGHHESPQSTSGGKKHDENRVKFQGSGDLLDEIQTEELAAQVQVAKLHCQFRKLPTPDEDLSKVVVTAVAEEQSKVMFAFDPASSSSYEQGRWIKRCRFDSVESDDSVYSKEEKIGWIMLECGIDDIGLKAARRLGFDSVDEDITLISSPQPTNVDSCPRTRPVYKASTAKSNQPKAKPKFYFHSNDASSDDTIKGEDSVRSTISVSTPEVVEETSNDEPRDLPGSSSNCVFTISTVWFNVPSPPKQSYAEITSGLVFDSNLLSTATPAINAWLTPVDQLTAALNNLTKAQHQRICGIMACIMAEALDLQSIHEPCKSKYNKITSWSKRLQEDPSCQLVTVLRKYLHQCDIQNIEEAVASGVIPAVSSLEKGIHALIRQWKVTLVAPGVADFGMLSRKSVFYPPPYLTYPVPPSYLDSQNLGRDISTLGVSDADMNEATGLLSRYSTLDADSQAVRQRNSVPLSGSLGPSLKPEYKLTYEEFSTRRRPSQTLGAPVLQPASSALLKDIASESPSRVQSQGYAGSHHSSNALIADASHVASFSRKESNPSMSASGGSLDPNLPSSIYGTPRHKYSTTMSSSQEAGVQTWVGHERRGESVGSTDQFSAVNPMYRPQNPFDVNYHSDAKQGLDSNATTLTSSAKDEFIPIPPKVNMSPPAIQLADAQLLFKPLLTNMGLKVTTGTEPSKLSEKYGDISVACKFDCIRADIIETDSRVEERPQSKPRGKRKQKRGIFFQVEPELPAFICENFIIESTVRDVFNKEQTDDSTPHKRRHLLPSEEDIERPTIEVHFTLNINEVTQNINMSLLRLMTQVMAMVDNVKQTRTDLKLNRYTASAMSGSVRYKTSKNKRTDSDRDDSKKRRSSRVERKISQISHTRQPSVSTSIKSTITDSDISEQGSDGIPKCWQTMYHLLDLYSTMPDPGAYSPQNVFVNPMFFINSTQEKEKDSTQSQAEEHVKSGEDSGSQEEVREHRVEIEPDADQNDGELQSPTTSQRPRPLAVKEHTHMHVFGVAMIQKTRLLATLGGLNLEAELRKIHGSINHKVKRKGASRRRSMESSASVHLSKALVVLLEKIDFETKTIVNIDVKKSNGLYSASSGRGKEKAASVLSVGAVNIDIPQHPAILHGMVARSTKKLSSQIQQLKRPMISKSFDVVEGVAPSMPAPPLTSAARAEPGDDMTPTTELPQLSSHTLTKPTKMTFKVQMKEIAIGAAILPSLRAQYKIGRIFSSGITGDEAQFSLVLPSHALSFSSKVSISEGNFPSSASIDFPPIEFKGEYKTEERMINPGLMGLPGKPIVRYGTYLDAVAKVGSFEHSLTTDLLNHLIFVQKVFVKEVEEVVQKMSDEEKPVPLWSEHGIPISADKSKPVLFSLHFKLDGIQVTATTPSTSAVRFETGAIELELSNRVQGTFGVSGLKRANSNLKLFGKAQVDLNLALGELVRNQVFEEAEPEFQQMAYFKTRIGLRNALQDEISSAEEDKEAVLISLKRPLFYVQPIAFDKAVLVYLNYKNAYENWHEQIILNKEVQTAAQAVFERLPYIPHIPQPDVKTLGTLFLQLTVDDLGICMPMTSVLQATAPTSKIFDTEQGSALVLTLESSLITACSSGSLVSKGIFKGFCLRFAEDFETSLDDWKPDASLEIIMNACTVPEGTYEVCSRTTRKTEAGEHLQSVGKWILSILWKMQGIDVQLDTRVGHSLSALFGTLTSFTGHAEDDDIADLNSVMENPEDQVFASSTEDISTVKKALSPTIASEMHSQYPDFDPKQRALMIEKEMNEQAKVVKDLRDLGASSVTIEEETKHLQELEAAVFKDFRRDVRKKLRRQSVRATTFRDRFVPGYKPATYHRSKSIAHPSQVTTGRGRMRYLDPNMLAEYNEELDRLPMGHSRTRSDGMQFIEPSSKVTFHTDGQSSTDGLSQSLQDPDIQDLWDEDDNSVSLNTTVNDPSCISAQLTKTPSKKRQPSKQLSLPEMWDKDSDSSNECESAYLKQAKRRIIGNKDATKKTDPRSTMIPTEKSVKPLQGFPAPKTQQPTSYTPSPAKPLAKPESNVDLEMDVQVFIDSGRLVLHPNAMENGQEEDNQSKGRHSKFAKVNIVNEVSTPQKKKSCSKQKSTPTPGGNYRPVFQGTSLTEVTVFVLPALDVKAHYNSKNYHAEASMGRPNFGSQFSSDSESNPPTDSADNTSQGSKKSGVVKRASLYAWVLLQTPPEEIVISPFLLDFLEQCLETIPIQTPSPTKGESSDGVGNVFNINDLEASATSLVSSSTYDYATFPVDIVVYLCVQPSSIRFICLPLSRVECLLKLPTLDLSLSSRRAQSDTMGLASSGESTQGRMRSLLRGTCNTARTRNMSGQRTRTSTAGSDVSSTASSLVASTKEGGLSFTACLSEFSLFIFHPYGGAHTKKTGLFDLGSITENPGSSFGRKDSLSLNVEFVRVNLCRSRLGLPLPADIHSSSLSRSYDALSSGTSTPHLQTPQHSRATAVAGPSLIKFSIVCDIGSASFKYDMRRLTEILAFPKAWYRRSIARRLFLGDESTHMMYPDNLSSSDSSIDLNLSTGNISPSKLRERSLRHSIPSTPFSTKPLSPKALGKKSAGGVSPTSPTAKSLSSSSFNSSPPPVPFRQRSHTVATDSSGFLPSFNKFLRHFITTDRNASSHSDESSSSDSVSSLPWYKRKSLRSILKGKKAKKVASDTEDEDAAKKRGKSLHTSTPTSQTSKASLQWETLVVFAVNLTHLDVQMNMSNVMGNTTWSTGGLKSQGRISVDYTGYKDMKISAGLGSSSLDAKGGVIGGLIELDDIDTFLHILEEPGKEPQHKAGAKMVKTEFRIDYMGSSIIMARLKLLEVVCKDEWKLNFDTGPDKVISTNRPMSIFINTELTWDKFQMMISRSTTPDLIKITYKLEEFFSQQFNSSKRVLSSLEPMASGRRSNRDSIASSQEKNNELEEKKHHRHWPGVASLITKIRLVKLSPSYPENSAILGGHCSLRGNHASLACFHGVNFRGKSWALFTMREPEMLFETEAQDIPSVDGESLETNVIQDLIFNLGHNQTTRAEYQSQYNFMATISRISRGRHANPPASVSSVQEWFHYACTTEGPEELEFFYREDGQEPSMRRRKSLEYNHDSETLFALPKLQLEMRTGHLQKPRPPKDDEPMPVVDVTFVTQFADHICVAMDVELLLFLHDIVNAYINEKTKGFSSSRGAGSSGKMLKSPDKEKKQETSISGITDWREFNCKTWQLEPTLRLLSWGGKKIDPVGVDYILQKLGFSHARVTIPKWIQRGAMDPMDKILSLLAKHVIAIMSEEDKHKEEDTLP